MIDEILISTGPRRHRLALLEGGRLVELYITRRGDRFPERLIMGRVKTLAKDLDAAFVDIGEGRDGLLSARDTAAKRGTPIAGAVQEGQSVLVQVKREAEEEKGVKLSARPRLAGRGLVLLPFGQGIEMPRRLSDPGTRQRLQAVAEGLHKDLGLAFLVRTGAGGMEDGVLLAEGKALAQRWRAITQTVDGVRPPEVLDPGDDPLTTLVRAHLNSGLKRICLDDGGLYREFAAVDGLAQKIELHDGGSPLFEHCDVDGQIDGAVAPQVALPSGGRIFIEHTQALTAIDVDSGQHDGQGDPARLARETNEQAAREIARQLRLREIGGRVVIDFIPMQGRGDVPALLKTLQTWLDDDPAPLRLGRMSEMGLVELTRRRRQPALALRLGEVCSVCQGVGRQTSARWIADNLLDRILREADVAKGRALAVRAAPAVAADLGGATGELLAGLVRERGCRVNLTADDAMALEDFEVAIER